MTASFRRARAYALLASSLTLLAATACTGHNDGRKDPFGNSTIGEGGAAPDGPAPGTNSDTTMIPAAAGAPTSQNPASGGVPATAGGAPVAPGTTQGSTTQGTTGGTKAP